MTQRAIRFEADLDISDVTRGLNRIEQHARRAGGTVGRVGGGLGRAGGGIGRTVGAGAGIGAGAAAFELIFQKIFELFEGTPVLETFVMALDTLFKAFGPVIGVLLESLTPVLIALTPAIEPLARALIPLIELFGAGLLVAVQLLTPAIVLFANGLENVTTFIKNTVLAGFRFIVDQLNKLPFVDIQADLDATGGSFDAMAGQIESAGDAAGTAGEQGATKQIKALSTEMDGLTPSTEDAAAAADQAKVAADLWARAARENKMAIEPLTTAMATLSDEMDETFTASDNLGIIIGKTHPQVSALTTQYIAENQALINLNPKMDVLTGEMDEMYTASDNLGIIIGASKGPAVDLAAAVDDMRMRIEDAQEAADLNQMAFDGLTPAMQAAAIELGIFRGKIDDVATAIANVPDVPRYSGSSSQRPGGGTQTSTVTVDANGNLIYSEVFSGDSGGPGASSSQGLYTDAAGNVYYDPGLQNPASGEAQTGADQITVNVQVGDETVEAVTSTSENRRGSE